MSIQAHLETLEAKHAQLEEKIREAYQHHLPTTELKKQKLLIKEELEALRAHKEVEYRKAA